MTGQPRQAPGTPTGGQFAASVRTESGVTLDAIDRVTGFDGQQRLVDAATRAGMCAHGTPLQSQWCYRCPPGATADAGPQPTRDQSYCDVGRHQQCSGYTEDEADPESCFCTCHDLDLDPGNH